MSEPPDPLDDECEQAFDAELNLRLAEIRSGQAIGVPAEEVFRDLREKYS